MILACSDWAYLAGFIDCDGCVGVTRTTSRGYSFFMSLANTCYEVLVIMRNRHGGAISNQSFVKAAEQGRKPSYTLSFRRAEIEIILPNIIPHLLIKRRQAELVLNYFTLFPRSVIRTQEQYAVAAVWVEECKLLNRRGSARSVQL